MTDHVPGLDVPASSLCADCGATPCRRGLKRGRCRNCYERHTRVLKKAGKFSSLNPATPAIDRLFDKAVAGWGGCLIYTGYIFEATGYGGFTLSSTRRVGAHRAAYELLVGQIPEGMHVDHICHNRDASCLGGRGCLHRRCINPHHLEAVTAQENLLRSSLTHAGSNARKTHCPKGHEYTPENTYSIPSRPGGRYCRECNKARKRHARELLAQAARDYAAAAATREAFAARAAAEQARTDAANQAGGAR